MQRPLAAKLDEAVRKVAPIAGVSIGRRDKRETWRANFTPEATPDQIAAAQQVIANFVEVDDPKPPRELAPLNINDVLELIGHFMPEAAGLESSNHIDLSERPDVVSPLEELKAKIDAVRAGAQEMTPDELLQMYRDEPPGAAAKLEDAVRALKGEARRKLSELLNVELAELKNLRGMAGEDREREQQIEYLLGLFTRLGEI